MYGGIEAGGTKFVCAVSEGGEILEKTSIPTTTPEETLDQVFEFFDRYELKGIGIGSFGPIGIDQTKDNYGYVLATPKKDGHNLIFSAQSGNATMFLLLGRRMSMRLHTGS